MAKLEPGRAHILEESVKLQVIHYVTNIVNNTYHSSNNTTNSMMLPTLYFMGGMVGFELQALPFSSTPNINTTTILFFVTSDLRTFQISVTTCLKIHWNNTEFVVYTGNKSVDHLVLCVACLPTHIYTFSTYSNAMPLEWWFVYCTWISDSPVLWKSWLTSLISPVGSTGHMQPCWLHCGGSVLEHLPLSWLWILCGLMAHLHEGGGEGQIGRRPSPSRGVAITSHFKVD